MKKIRTNCIITSSAKTIKKNQIYNYKFIDKNPEIGDVIYGKVVRLGQHIQLENKNARLHTINDGSVGVFVFGNRYAPDYYEGFIPTSFQSEVDLMSRSGVIGKVKYKNASKQDPTIIKILGYIVNKDGIILNTKNFNMIKLISNKKTNKKRAKLILNIGTSMNSGKSMSSAACCWVLSSLGYGVRFSKITGTASLKDILNAEDKGAEVINDFTYMGYPSTYMLDEEELLNIFNTIDLKYGNNYDKFWVVEFADGILQRETAMLLNSDLVKKRIHKLIFSADSALSAIGGIDILKRKFNLIPDAISGICSSSPLDIRELSEFIDIPVFDNINPKFKELIEILKG
ncbi:MAG TPA: hypothetical protein VMZ91_03230 [Candidatus Paceibacterota bacterium]|nr:hypothetical protein [Candidatus Paceibacterota bacterium]